jgi:hypothetical protein
MRGVRPHLYLSGDLDECLRRRRSKRQQAILDTKRALFAEMA